ncbi:MAG TPA: hypothetical protein VFZ34_33395 [Blastocatellia bacterium]|nr:hypothetical protein [Blastocatellia bacterium]
MTPKEPAQSDSKLDALRKQILSLSYEDIQQLKFNFPPLPPAKSVTIRVERDAQSPKGRVLRVKQDSDTITSNEQLMWTCPDGRLEIRLSRAQNPFAGDLYEVARGGKVFSGKPNRVSKPRTFVYTFLVTTPDGYFLTLDWPITVAPASNPNSKRARQVTK